MDRADRSLGRFAMKVLICVPAFGHQMNSQTAVSLIALTKELADRQIFGGCNAVSFPDLVDLRNIFLTLWYDRSDATHLLLVDADMQFEPDLVGDMLLADKPLVGCIYPKKRLPLSWVGSPLEPPAEPEGGLLELEYAGCGVMLIRRDCVDAMIAANAVTIETDLRKTALAGLLEPHGATRIIQAFDKTVTADDRKLSEDFSFCHRHRQAGGKVYAVINHTVTHLGVMPFTARYGDLYAGKEAEMLDSEKAALEQKLRAECEEGYAIGPGAVGPYSVTGETFTEVVHTEQGRHFAETVYYASAQAAYDAALKAFKSYASGKTGALYWRVPPELGFKDGKFAFYMRLLISDMPVIKKAASTTA